jgi:two-component system sensor histidine kinase YesM
MNEQWYKDVVAANGANFLFGPYLNSDNEYVFAIGRVLNTYSNDTYTNVLKIEIPEKSIYSLMEKEGINKKIYLLDSTNKIVSTTDRLYLGKDIDTISEIGNLEFMRSDINSAKLDKKSGIAFYGFLNERNAINDWKVVSIISSEAMLKDIYGIVKYSMMICVTSFLIAILFVLLFSNKLTKRLEMLVRNMAKIRGENFNAFVSFEENDEIGALSKSIKSMVDRINNLIKEVYVLDIKKKEAEINALQSQINPHFLFNTMESIRMNLWKKQDYETSEVIQNFAHLLRKSIDWSSYNITLKHEIDLVSAYLEIQKYRYKDKVDYEITVSEELVHFIIPKFTLQPIVENAIYHGIEMKKGKGKLILNAEIVDNKLKIVVQDDGVGMDPNTLEFAREQIYSEQQVDGAKRSVGIRNVHQRLKLHFGDEYGININSEINVGTIVEIYLPINTEGTVDSHV